MRGPITRRWLGRMSVAAAVAVCVAFGVRQAVAQAYSVPMGSMEPELPRGSRILVSKLARHFAPGDIIAYRHATGLTYLGRVESVDGLSGDLTISRNGTPPTRVSAGDIIGRVVLSTR